MKSGYVNVQTLFSLLGAPPPPFYYIFITSYDILYLITIKKGLSFDCNEKFYGGTT